MLELNALLVPTDFSPTAAAAFRYAQDLAAGESPQIILLHVIDPETAAGIAALGLASEADATAAMRERARRELDLCLKQARDSVTVESIVSEGVPFAEIIRKASDFQVDAVVMGRVGLRGGIERLLFGTTAEHVIRGCARPVIVLPVGPPEPA